MAVSGNERREMWRDVFSLVVVFAAAVGSVVVVMVGGL